MRFTMSDDRSVSDMPSAVVGRSSASGVLGEAPLIQSLARADAILTAVAAFGPGGAGLAEIARQAGLHRATTHHLLRTLMALGFVERVEHGRNYRIGIRPLQLIWQSDRLRELSAHYHATLMRICHRTGETINLAVAYGDAALVVTSLEGPGIIRASNYTGAVWPLHATGCGKAMLAFGDEQVLERIVAAPLPRFTPHTVTDPAALRVEIARIREEGHAIEVEEHEPGAACVGVPLFGVGGRLLGTVSVAAPLARMDETRRQELAALVVDEVRRGADTAGGARRRQQRPHVASSNQTDLREG